MDNFIKIKKSYHDNTIAEIFLGIIFVLFFKKPLLISIYHLLLFIKYEKNKDILLFSFYMGMLAYFWDIYSFENNFDLLRHHETFHNLKYMSSSEIVSDISFFNLLQPVIIYILTFFQDVNLLQFTISFISIYLLTKVICESIPRDLDKYSLKIMMFLFVFSSVRLLYLISGLWNVSAMILFSYAYLSNFSQKKKAFLMVIAGLIHSSLLIILMIYLFSNLISIRNRMHKISLFIFGLCSFLLLTPIITEFLYLKTSINFFYYVNSRFIAYFYNSEQFSYLHNVRFLLVEYSKIFLVIVLYVVNLLNNHESIGEDDFPQLIVLFTLIISYFSPVFLRFSSLVIIISMPMLFSVINNILLEIKRCKFKKYLSPDVFALVAFNIVFLLQVLYEIYSLYNARIIGVF